MNHSIIFPNLHIHLHHVGQSFQIGGFTIAYYGCVIALGMLAGLALALHQAKKSGQDAELYMDFALVGIVLSVLGARAYYVIFRWDEYKDDILSILNIRQGGLAIYGGVIVGVLSAILYCKIRKIKFALFADTAVLGLITGQVIGRWGNFFNREAFGGYCTNLFAMQLPLNAVRKNDVTPELMEHLVTIDGESFIQVHPTFLYESLWNLAVLILLLVLWKHKKFDGEIFFLYLFGYGIGRFWIEALRTDQLLLPVIRYPVSRALAAVLAVGSAIWIVIFHRRAVLQEKRKKILKE